LSQDLVEVPEYNNLGKQVRLVPRPGSTVV
jgi:hypothetical protein